MAAFLTLFIIVSNILTIALVMADTDLSLIYIVFRITA